MLDDSAVIFVTNGENQPWFIREFGAPAPGRYRVRVTASAYQSEGRPLTMRIYDGYFLPGGSGKRISGYFDVPPDKPITVEAEVYLESPRDTFRILPYNLPGRGNKAGLADYKGPGLRVYGIEIEGPLAAAEWPPRSRAALLGDVDPARGTEADAHAILRRFAPRAFRRPLGEPELAPYLAFASDRLKAGGTFEQAVRAGLKAMLVSPRFILLDSSPGRLDGYALASRLSYFLWSTMPDDALLAAAADGSLVQAPQLRAQVDRMLRDPKAATFTKNFTDQWLELRQIDATTPDKQLYPEFDEWLQVSMLRETRAFFDEVTARHSSPVSSYAAPRSRPAATAAASSPREAFSRLPPTAPPPLRLSAARGCSIASSAHPSPRRPPASPPSNLTSAAPPPSASNSRSIARSVPAPPATRKWIRSASRWRTTM